MIGFLVQQIADAEIVYEEIPTKLCLHEIYH